MNPARSATIPILRRGGWETLAHLRYDLGVRVDPTGIHIRKTTLDGCHEAFTLGLSTRRGHRLGDLRVAHEKILASDPDVVLRGQPDELR